jgi:hypothetical protein
VITDALELAVLTCREHRHFDRSDAQHHEVETRSEAQSPEWQSVLNRSLRFAFGYSRDDGVFRYRLEVEMTGSG